MCYSNLNNHKRAFQTQSMHYHYYPLKEPPHFPSSGLSVLPLTHTFQGLAEVSISSLPSLNSFQGRRSLQPYLRELAGFSRTLRAWDDTYHLWCWGFLGYSLSHCTEWTVTQWMSNWKAFRSASLKVLRNGPWSDVWWCGSLSAWGSLSSRSYNLNDSLKLLYLYNLNHYRLNKY